MQKWTFGSPTLIGGSCPISILRATVVDERALAERLITYDTSRAEELAAAAAFVRGWLEAREIEVREHAHNGLPVLVAEAGADGNASAPTVIFHGHLDVVPGLQEQYEPRVEGDRLIGRGAYDMKGGLAAMMCALKDCAAQDRVRVRFICVPDEEAEDVDARSTDELVSSGLRADFAITGEPTDLHIGVQAKGVLAMRIEVAGRSAHGSTPWLGDSAVLKAFDVFRRIEALPFSRESSELFDRPSINLGRIAGGDAFNKVPDQCEMVVDVRYLPGQDPGAILADVRAMDDVTVTRTLMRAPAYVSRSNPYVRALRDAIARTLDDEAVSVGRDGASDAISFLEAGIPAVEFGPSGSGHHGPDEWVSIMSLQRYRRALGDFVRTLPAWLQRAGTDQDPARLHAIEGGLA
jgi:succinyl-diaminopimelate desuccinylase